MGTAKKASNSATVIKASGVAVSADDRNRKSKWDQMGGSAPMGSLLGPAPLTTTATGKLTNILGAITAFDAKLLGQMARPYIFF